MVQSHLKAWDGEEGTDPVSRQMAGIRVLGIRMLPLDAFRSPFPIAMYGPGDKSPLLLPVEDSKGADIFKWQKCRNYLYDFS